MAVVYSTSIKNARMTIVRDALNSGKLKIGTASFGALLVELNLTNPSGGVAGGVINLTPPPLTGTAVASGTAAEAQLTTSADVVVASGLTVGTSGADVLLNTVVIETGQPVEITSATVTHG